MTKLGQCATVSHSSLCGLSRKAEPEVGAAAAAASNGSEYLPARQCWCPEVPFCFPVIDPGSLLSGSIQLIRRIRTGRRIGCRRFSTLLLGRLLFHRATWKNKNYSSPNPCVIEALWNWLEPLLGSRTHANLNSTLHIVWNNAPINIYRLNVKVPIHAVQQQQQPQSSTCAWSMDSNGALSCRSLVFLEVY